ncbi:MAG: glucose-6-phosphate isomerase [Paludibacteraceae bacterium]|nr:glucose-6-phosphate isomerase [Paludibacteraceae bacterium]
MIQDNYIQFECFYASEQQKSQYADFLNKSHQANCQLERDEHEGKDFLGWLHLPSATSTQMLDSIETEANRLRHICDVVVVIGIGGSYLGAKAVTEAFVKPLSMDDNDCRICFAGYNMSADYMQMMLDYLSNKRYGIVVISKSGTTTEPAISFRILRKHLEQQVGIDEARKRIVAITDRSKGALLTIAKKEGYPTFPIEDSIGGRYSVFSPVGLFPIALAGIDIRAFVQGALKAETFTDDKHEGNIAEQYAAWRQLFYADGRKIEILASYNPRLNNIAEWWKQLFGESEGKNHKGIFPASANFSTDLHSVGQWIQDGERSLFETVLEIKQAEYKVEIPYDKENIDNLNYIANKNIEDVNASACLGTMKAHAEGDVPLLHFSMPRLTPEALGTMLYTFERACAISGYMLGVNPFDQPGVEAYKRNLFTLLGKPGY